VSVPSWMEGVREALQAAGVLPVVPELQGIANRALSGVQLVFSEPYGQTGAFGGTESANMDVTITNGTPYLLKDVVVALKATGAAIIISDTQKYFEEIQPNESKTWTIGIQAQNLTGKSQPQRLPASFTGSISAEVVPMAVKDLTGYKTVDVWPE